MTRDASNTPEDLSVVIVGRSKDDHQAGRAAWPDLSESGPRRLPPALPPGFTLSYARPYPSRQNVRLLILGFAVM